MSSKSGLIRPVTLELFALDCWKMLYMTLFGTYSFNYYLIVMKLADNLSRHKIARVQNLGRVDLLWSYLP